LTARGCRRSRRSRRTVRSPFVQLREFAEFCKFDAPQTPCCLTSSDEEQEEDPEAYAHCDECPVADRLEGLCGANREAYDKYRQVVTRFNVDTHAAPLVLRRITEDLDQFAFEDLIERFGILHDVLNPPPKDPNG
jgi:hypothetical protein